MWYNCVMRTYPRSDQLSLDSLLGGGLAGLDLTAQEHDLVVSRYRGMGVVLDEHWSSTRGDNAIAPQGSFLLGTVVRNVHRDDDVDIDVVTRRGIDKTSITQADLKHDVGVAAATYASRTGSGSPSLQEWERCWTLSWPRMHMDLLPALPDPDGPPDSLLITDRTVRSWLPSNPSGYAAWFRGQMQEELRVRMSIEAKRLGVEQVPGHLIKTTLQQTVQALKRHRDIFFAGRLLERPSSIVITTLAALAYPGGGALYDVLRHVTSTMGGYLRHEGGLWLLPNPSQPKENFVDSWVGKPSAPSHLFEWLEVAAQDFAFFGAHQGLHRVMPLLESAFGSKVATRASNIVSTAFDDARAGGRLAITSGGLLTGAGVRSGTSDQKVRNHGYAGGRTR